MSTGALSAKDANITMSSSAAQDNGAKPHVKSMEYHRQVLQSKMAAEES